MDGFPAAISEAASKSLVWATGIVTKKVGDILKNIRKGNLFRPLKSLGLQEQLISLTTSAVTDALPILNYSLLKTKVK